MQQHSEAVAVHHLGVACQYLARKTCAGGRIFKPCRPSESFKSGRGLLPTWNCNVAPLPEPTHDPNKHIAALRHSGSPSSWCDGTISCQADLWRQSNFQILPLASQFLIGRGVTGIHFFQILYHLGELQEWLWIPKMHTWPLTCDSFAFSLSLFLSIGLLCWPFFFYICQGITDSQPLLIWECFDLD